MIRSSLNPTQTRPKIQSVLPKIIVVYLIEKHNMNVHARENDAMRVERESDETRGERREAEERRDS